VVPLREVGVWGVVFAPEENGSFILGHDVLCWVTEWADAWRDGW